MIQIAVTSVFVDDQSKALTFYKAVRDRRPRRPDVESEPPAPTYP